MNGVIGSDQAPQIRMASGINTALGLYAVASPWAWGYSVPEAAMGNGAAAEMPAAAPAPSAADLPGAPRHC